MFQCLSEPEIRQLLTGQLAGERGAGATAHLGECPACAALRERVRGSTSSGQHQAATQIEVAAVTSDPQAHTLSSSSPLVDHGATLADAAAPPRGSVSIDVFLENLSQSGLLPPAEVKSVRDQSNEPSRGTTVADLVSWLIGENKLTRYQAELLCRGQRGGLVLGNYIILDKIGQGGMGTVFKARHRRMNRLVALKVLPASLSSIPEAINRFQREVEAAARLSHPNIAAAYDADEAEGVHFLVMEYVDGPTLASYVKEKGALPVGAAVHIMAQAARGLAAAHGVGIVHRDIKPSNLMVNRQGRLKILDMGLAQMRDSASDVDLTSDVTQTGRVMGTVDYMAPEQARDAKNVDYRADIYSLGCTAYFLLAGRTPAPAGSAAEKLLFHQALTAEPLANVCPDASPRLAAIVTQMMAKKAEDRPQSLVEIAEEFDRCLAEQPAGAELALEGTELTPDGPSSTLHGSRPDKLTMVNLNNTVTSVTQAKRNLLTGEVQPAPAPAQGRLIALMAGSVGIFALAALIAVPLLNKPPRPLTTNPPGPVVPVATPPATGGSDQPPKVASATKRVETLPTPPVKPVSPHAKYEPLLTWVFQNRGSVEGVTGAGQPVSLAALGELPAEPITILKIKLDGTGVRDSELANLASTPGLRELSLADTKITDAGLAHLEVLRQLTHLNLASTAVKSAGLAPLARLSELVELDLSHTQITDQGLARLAGLGMLQRLNLADTAITDSGLDQLKGLRSLRRLTLNGTGLSEAQHQALCAALPDLQIAWDGADVQRAIALRLIEKGAVLAVADRAGQVHQGLKTRDSLPSGRIIVKEIDLSPASSISDDDLKQLISLPEIESLRLVNLTLTPAGLAHLQALASLKKIDLGTTRLPAASLDALAKALPTCKLIVKEPADAEVARAAIAAGGKVSLVTQRGETLSDLTDVAKLPATSFTIRSIKLDNLADIGDPFLARMSELPELESLFLSGTSLTDEGLLQLGACKSLRELGLSGTKIGLAGVGSLSRLPQLARLYLARTSIGSEGVRQTATLSHLTHLSLESVALTDDDLALLKRLEHLQWLDVSGTPLTDASLVHLTQLPKLQHLDITGTQLTDAGQEELSAATSGTGCNIAADPLDPQRLAARWIVQNKGTVSLDSGPLKSLKELPRDACRIVSIDLAELSNLKPGDILKHLAGCSDLQILNLSETSLRASDLAAMGGLRSLRVLRLTSLPVSDAALQALAGLDKLEVLDLSRTNVTGSGLASLSPAAGLRELLLADSPFDEQYFVALAAFPNLDTLDLSAGYQVTGAGLAQLDKLPGLKSLGLRGAKITDGSLDRVAQLTNLETLDLEGTPITDDGVARLASLPKLQKIVLTRTGVTDGVAATLGKMKSLRDIRLAGTKLTPAAIKDLKAALPGCQVVPPMPPTRDPNDPATFGGATP